jgi:hypothetical protein
LVGEKSVEKMSVGVAHKIPGSLYIILGHILRSKCPGGASGGEPGSASKSAEGARYEWMRKFGGRRNNSPKRHYTSFTKVPLLIEVNTKKKCYELRESPEMYRIDHEGIAKRVTKEKVRYRDTLGK